MRTYLRFVLGVIALGLAALMAQGKGGQNPGGHLRVTEVLVDFNAQAIEITGEDFDFGPGPLTISLGELGDISALSTVRFLPYQAGFPTKRVPSATPQVLAPRRFTTAASYGAMRPSSDVSSTADNQFVARASGGVFFYSDAGLTTGVELPSGSGSWSTLSDRNVKDNVAEVDGNEILAQIAAMPISKWNYITQDESIRHIGPMAQDFYSAFGLGEDNRRISSVDADGIALAAIKELHKVIGEQAEELKSRNLKIQSLEERLQALEAMFELLDPRASARGLRDV